MFDIVDAFLLGLIIFIILVTLITGWLPLAWAAAFLTLVGMFRSWPE